MIRTINQLKNKYSKYSNVLCKIAHEEKKGSLIRLKKGIYEDNKNIDPLLLANHIVKPSYVSFETALSYYNLIPEKVYTITSASLNKRKNKSYSNFFGTYTYSDIPKSVYSDFVLINQKKEYGFLIAAKEKAILDTLYKAKSIKNKKLIIKFLIEDLRIELEDIMKLDYDIINEIGPKYNSKNINFFIKFLNEVKKQ